MAVQVPRLPKYRHYRPKDLAVVRLAGKDHYLGKYGSEESREAYRRLIAEHLAAPLPPSRPPGPDAGLTIDGLILAYFERFVHTYYVKDGRPTSEVDNVRQALRFLRPAYGTTPAASFSPLALRAVREEMVRSGRCRNLINKDIGRVRGMFRWAVEHELLPLATYQALATVAGLRQGRSGAKERPPVGPVADEVVERTLTRLSPTVATMVRVQLFSGMRPQEVVLMRAADLDRTDPACWVYTPPRHKSEHHGRQRQIHLGPRAIDLLRPYLEEAPAGFLFSPRRAEARRRAELRARRGSPPTPSQLSRRPKAEPRRSPGERYDVGSYRKAIRRACKKLDMKIWFPHQLRHSAATLIRARFGLEAAQVVLGHQEAVTSQIYAQRDERRAREVMKEIG
jgi:integrase